MAAITFTPTQSSMGARVSDVPAFPGEHFSLTIPEAIGDTARTAWPNRVSAPVWSQRGEGNWFCRAQVEDELAYTAQVTTTADIVDIRIALTNNSDRRWRHSTAFTCFNSGAAPSVIDHECTRHWVGHKGERHRLIELPRTFGPRPTVQLYSVEGQPPGEQIPFVASFRSTPNVALEGWMAIEAKDGKRLVGIASKPALFLFQNMEFSCIHSCPSFGSLSPGETGHAATRVYFVESTIDAWHTRVKEDLDTIVL
jgi:hypothetical protein